DAGENMEDLARRPVLGGTNSLHALTQQNVAQGSEQNHQQNKNVSFQVQARRVFHTLLASALALRVDRVRPADKPIRAGSPLIVQAPQGVKNPTAAPIVH